MSAEIIDLAERRPVEAFNAGNGAREALIEIVSQSSSHDHGDRPELGCADFILAMLWYRGFKIVPLGDGAP